MTTNHRTRRELLAAACAAAAATAAGAETVMATPASAQQQIGPPPHTKGPLVFMDYDQVELDAAYTQLAYAPNGPQIQRRWASTSDEARKRIGQPEHVAYGPTEIEKLDIYRTRRANAPIHVHIHGGAWRQGNARDRGFAAEMFIVAGAHFVVPDYVLVQDAGGSLMPMADQVRRAVAWVYKNAASFGGDPRRIYLSGSSAGGHLAAVALVTDWKKDFGLPADIIKGGLCNSGIYELKPVRLSSRSTYVKFDDAMEQALSPQRHLDKLRAPVIVAYGTEETPEFQRQNREFAAAVKASGKPAELIVGANYNHFELQETLGNPYGVLGRAALKQMNLA